MFELQTYREEGKLTRTFKNDMRNLANFHRLNNSNFILEIKMAKQNRNKNLKKSRSTRSSVKTYLGYK